MRSHFLCKSLAFSLLATCVFSAQIAAAAEKEAAKEMKPVVVCSFSGYDALYADIETLGKVSGNPDLALGLESMLKFATRSHGLEGLDQTKPWGAAIFATEPKPSGYVFLPVDDLDKLLAVLEPFIGKTEDVGDGVLKVSGGRSPADSPAPPPHGKKGPLFIKKQGSWAVISLKKENLALAAENPGELLGDLPKNYDLAIRIEAADIPAELRDKFIAKMQKNVQRDLNRRPGEDEAEYSVRKLATNETENAIKVAVSDAKQITLGWNLDNKSERAYLDLIVSARSASEMQKQMARWGTAKTRFAGFCPADAAWSINCAGQLPDCDTSIIKDVFKIVQTKAVKEVERHEKSESRQESAKALLADLFEFGGSAVDAKRFDGAASLLLAPDSATLLAGKHVPNAAKLEQIAGRFADMVVEKHPDIKQFITVKPDVEEYMGVKLHSLSLQIQHLDAEKRAKIAALVGEPLEVVLGVGEDSIYLAAGREPLAKLKKAIADSAEKLDAEVPPLRMSIGLRSLAGVLAETAKTDGERAKAAALAKILSKAENDDHLVLTLAAVEEGLRLRLEAEGGIVKAIGEMSTLLPADMINK